MAIRLSGLTSGMDTDAIVQELVSAYSKKTEKYEKASTKLTWKQDAWKGLNTKIYDLYTKVSNMRYSSAYNLRKTSVSDATKATVTASANAVTGTQKLKINSTAQSSYMTGAYLGEGITADSTLEDLGYKGSYTKLKLKDAEGKVTEIGVKKDTKISEVLTKIKDAGLNASLDTNNGRIFINAKTSGEKSDFTLYGDSVNALDALDALGLNTAMVESVKDENGNIVKKFTGAAGSFSEYYGYYKEALTNLIAAPTRPDGDEVLTAPTEVPEPGEGASDTEKEAYDQYKKELKSYNTWSEYRENLAAYEQYEKDFYLATSDSFEAYKEKMTAKGYADSVCDEASYAEKRNEAIDDVLLYKMKDVYNDYTNAFKENNQIQIEYTALKNTNNAWQAHLDRYETQYAASTSFDTIMEEVGKKQLSRSYSEEEVAQMIKDLRLVDIYETDKEGKKTAKLSQEALNKMDALGVSEDDAKELLEVFDAMSEDVDKVEKYVKSIDDMTELTGLQIENPVDENGDPIYENDKQVLGVKGQIDKIKADMATNQTQLDTWQAQMDANQKIIDANSDMIDLEVTDADGNLDQTKLSLALVEFADKAKKAAEMVNDTTGKYDGTKDSAIKIKGSNAEIELNGVTYTSESNSFAINGLTINTLATTNSEISITTSVDTQGIYDKVKEFLTEYNNVMNEMCKLYNADSAKDYEPLTDEEKEAMSDEQIEKWEGKIKDSLLRRDGTLNSIMNVMVNAMATSFEIDGQSLSLSTFGIQTLGFLNAPKNEHYAYHIDGDEDDENTSGKKDKLMQAIEANPEQVEEFMKKLCSNLYSAVDAKMKSTELSSAYKVYNDKEMDKELKKYAEAISKWEEKVKDKEDYYFKQFSNMEVALSKLQNQTSSISGLFQ